MAQKGSKKAPKGAPPAALQSQPIPSSIDLELGPLADRIQLIKAIEQRRSSRVLVYATIGRPDVGAQMGLDVVPIIHDHLEQMGHQERIDLFLYTHGGFTLSSPRIAYLLREYCDELSVLVPRFAHSAGTTLCLAADHIVMHRMGELGPIDPDVANVFNPPNPGDQNSGKVNISVEDVTAYLELASEIAKVPDTSMGEVFQRLGTEIHPLALGNVYRQYLLIRSMGKRLLETHMDAVADQDRIENIMAVLTKEMYFHGYPISRTEAREHVGLEVIDAEPDLEREMWDLYASYREDLKPDVHAIGPDPSTVKANTTVSIDTAVIESSYGTHTFRMKGVASPNKKQDGIDAVLAGKWEMCI